MANAKILRNVLMMATMLCFAMPAHAQERSKACDVTAELIFKFRPPEAEDIGSYNVWDGMYGLQEMQERFVTGAVDGVTTIAAGERRAEEGDKMTLVLAGFARKGRLVWEQEHKIAGLEHVLKMLPTKHGLTLVGNKVEGGRKAIWFGFFSADGRQLTGQKTVFAPEGGDLEAHDVILAPGGEKYMLAASYQVSGDKGFAKAAPPGGVIYTLSSQAAVLGRWAYLPGIDNRIFTVRPIGAEDFIAAGYATAEEDGRRVGWVMRVDKGGGVIWQRQYPRGAGAEITVATPFLKEDVVLGGAALPSAGTGGYESGWLMALDGRTGEIGWQRYYTGAASYRVRDLMAHEGGLLSALLDTHPAAPESEEATRPADYAQLLTVDRRGNLIENDEFFNGEGARAGQIINGPAGERLLFGETNMKYMIEGVDGAEDTVKRSLDGWVLAAPSAGTYDDPCGTP